jgi:hypothetical protein
MAETILNWRSTAFGGSSGQWPKALPGTIAHTGLNFNHLYGKAVTGPSS